jgi:hypothetical protein
MILGSHKSLSYITPKKWWMWFLTPMYKHQSKDLEQQLKEGIRVLDINVRFDDYGNVVVCDGIYESKSYNPRVFTLHTINKIDNFGDKDTDYYIILTLDTKKASLVQEVEFIKLCKDFTSRYFRNNVYLIGCRRKFDNEKVYVGSPDFTDMSIISATNQPDSRWYEKLVPWFYAKRKNETIEPTSNVTLLDFI